MKTIPEQVQKLLDDQRIWYIATCRDHTPNAVPVAFKQILPDGRLAVADVFMQVTKANVEANDKIAVSACDASTMEGYQMKGTAEYLSGGPIVDQFKAVVEEATKGGLHAKGVVVITPEVIISTGVGPDNNKQL